MDKTNTIKRLFYIRICLWFVALVSTIYWMYYSFHLYSIGIVDEHEYASALRPVFAKALLISLIAVGVSFILRRISDNIKDSLKHTSIHSDKIH